MRSPTSHSGHGPALPGDGLHWVELGRTIASGGMTAVDVQSCPLLDTDKSLQGRLRRLGNAWLRRGGPKFQADAPDEPAHSRRATATDAYRSTITTSARAELIAVTVAGPTAVAPLLITRPQDRRRVPCRGSPG